MARSSCSPKARESLAASSSVWRKAAGEGGAPQGLVEALAELAEQAIAPGLDSGAIAGDDVVEAAALEQAPGLLDLEHAGVDPALRGIAGGGGGEQGGIARVGAEAL
jgi:hypothetical protein